jgi:hypothetical protein
MNQISRGLFQFVASLAFATVSLAPVALAQTSSASAASSKDQWIHVRVESKDNSGETVRVNVPVEMAEKVLPAINKEHLRNGKVHIDSAHLEDVDLRAMIDAVRTSKDGEYVTVQSKGDDVRIAKSNGYLYIHVTDKQGARKSEGKESAKGTAAKESKVEIKIPMKVVDALFSAGKDELDVVAALHALAANGDMELVSVKDSDNTVRIWIDSKNVSD